MRKTAIILPLILLLLVLGVSQTASVRTGAGVVAHHVCSATFVSRLDETEANLLLKTLIGPSRHLAHYSINQQAKTVDAYMLFSHAHATYTPGYGCRLNYPSEPSAALIADTAAVGVDPLPLVTTENPALKTALDAEFDDSSNPPRRVKAVVILKDGHIVAERYAPGYGVATPLLSFSVAKSITNALLGILVKQGRLNMDAPANVPEWSTLGDPRGRITPDQLLRMESGLAAAETGSGFDPASQMLYIANDMGAFAANHRLAIPPATRWDYTSCDTLILNRIMRQIIGGPAEFRRFADQELFQRIGMKNVTLEFDGAGTFIGSNHAYAPARSFAQLGLLFMNDGVAPDGTRVLPEGWVAYSRRSTLGSTYGAGFWTNDGASSQAAWRVAHGFPKDGFFASGNLGQRIYVIPSAHLVITRFGYSKPPDFGIEADVRLIATAIATLGH